MLHNKDFFLFPPVLDMHWPTVCFNLCFDFCHDAVGSVESGPKVFCVYSEHPPWRFSLLWFWILYLWWIGKLWFRSAYLYRFRIRYLTQRNAQKMENRLLFFLQISSPHCVLVKLPNMKTNLWIVAKTIIVFVLVKNPDNYFSLDYDALSKLFWKSSDPEI